MSYDSAVKISYKELGYNELSVITNEYFGPKSPFSTWIDLDITNLGYNKRIWQVPSSLS